MTKRILTDTGEDITEAVQILYDIAHGSLDWGSGFLDNAEMATIIRLAILCGWELPCLNGALTAMTTVALEFPDHYTVEERPYQDYDGTPRIAYKVTEKRADT